MAETHEFVRYEYYCNLSATTFYRNLKSHALKTLKWCPLDTRLFMVTTTSGWMRVCDATMGKEIHGKKFEGEVNFDWNEYNTTNSRVAVADGSASMKVIDFRW